MRQLIVFTTEEKSWILNQMRELLADNDDIKLSVINPNKCEVVFTDAIHLYNNDAGEIIINETDVILPRINESDVFTKLGLLNAFAGRLINCSDASMWAGDKFLSQVLFTKNGIKTPKTFLVGSNFLENFDDFVKEYFDDKFPVIVKTTKGTHGCGVILCESKRSLKSTVQYLDKKNEHYLLQEFIDHKESRRIITLGDTVLAANRREVAKSDFRTNAHQGSETEAIEPSECEIEIAQKCAKLFGLEFSAVDYIMIDDEPVVLEINSSPGLENIQTNYKDKNLVKELMDYCLKVDVEEDPCDSKDACETDCDESTKIIYNAEAHVVIDKINGWQPITAKIDTGAGLCSLHGENIIYDEKHNTIKFEAFDKTYTMLVDRYVYIKNSNGRFRRPVVKFNITINDQFMEDVDFTINDRTDLKYDALIGRYALEQGEFVVKFENNHEEVPDVVEESIENYKFNLDSNGMQHLDLTETPMLIPDIGTDLTNEKNNKRHYNRLMSIKSKQLFEQLSPRITVYTIHNDSDDLYFAVDTDLNTIVYYMSYLVTKNNPDIGTYVHQNYVWIDNKHFAELRDYPTKMFKKLLIENDVIVTDYSQVADGKRFWYNRMIDMLKDNLYVYFYNEETHLVIEITDVDLIDKFASYYDAWSAQQESKMKRFIISQKKINGGKKAKILS